MSSGSTRGGGCGGSGGGDDGDDDGAVAPMEPMGTWGTTEEALVRLKQVKQRTGAVREFEERLEQVRGLEQDLEAAAEEPEYAELIKQEIAASSLALPELLQALLESLAPENPDLEKRQVILEIRAGAGGTEAALFGADLFLMYQRWAARQRWQWEGVQSGDFVAVVKGEGVYR
ncbi:MAG: PCRF domain-containing protein, partial [archaeon]|nr:PCRF domain-containing protein [archaeon]